MRGIQEGNISSSSVSYVTVNFKKVVGNLSCPNSTVVKKRIYQEKNEVVRIALKHNNGLRSFPYAI